MTSFYFTTHSTAKTDELQFALKRKGSVWVADPGRDDPDPTLGKNNWRQPSGKSGSESGFWEEKLGPRSESREMQSYCFSHFILNGQKNVSIKLHYNFEEKSF